MWLYWKQMWPGMSTTWKSWLCLYLYSNRGPNSQKSTQPKWKKKKTFWKIVGLTRWEQPSALSSFLRLCVDLEGLLRRIFKFIQSVFYSICIHVTHVRTWNRKNLLSRFLLWLCWDYSPTNTIPYGVCLRCKLSTVKRILWLLRVSFIPCFSLSQWLYDPVLIWRRKAAVFQYENMEKAGAINRNSKKRMYLFSSRGLKVSFRFKEMRLHCWWTFLQTGCNVNKRVEERLCQGDAHTRVWFYQGLTPQADCSYVYIEQWHILKLNSAARGLRGKPGAASSKHCCRYFTLQAPRQAL